MDDTQQPLDPQRMHWLSEKLDSVSVEVQQLWPEFSCMSQTLLSEHHQLAHDLANVRREKQVLSDKLDRREAALQDLETDKRELVQALELARQEATGLIERLESAEHENRCREDEKALLAQELASESLAKNELGRRLQDLGNETRRLEGEEERLTQEVVDLRQKGQELAERLEGTEKQNRALEKENGQLKARTKRQDRANAKLKKEQVTWKEKHDMSARDLEACRSARMALTADIQQITEKVEREKLESGMLFVRELSPLLADLSDLSDLEPERVQGLKPRSVFEKLKAWMERTARQSPVPFPPKDEMSAAHTIYLDPDEAGTEVLMAMYDWQPNRPFERLPIGERRQLFRVLRRGWQLGTDILVRAQVSVQRDNGKEDSSLPEKRE